ncbi:MAG: SH3 domain-containing protein, partial [Eubacteriales bacterium]|nr:SH3 domain-containing protein [Eubacteriales bacterium]
MRRVFKVMLSGLAAAAMVSGNGLLAMADGVETQVAGLGAELVNLKQAAVTTTAELTGYDAVAVAQCEEYVNIRDAAGTDGNVLGKMYNNCAATILGKDGDWYLVTSGSVTGYVDSSYFVTGEDAAVLAGELGVEVAVVQTDVLMVRAEASTEADVLDMVSENDTLLVQESEADWAKVTLANGTEGYVSQEYIVTEAQFETAESIEEEAARLRAEKAAAEQQAAAERAAAEQAAAKQAA